MAVKLLWFYFLSYGALLLGFFLRRWSQYSPLVMRASVYALEAPLFLYAFWVLDFQQTREYAIIPLFSLALLLGGLAVHPLWAKMLSSDPRSQGSLVLASSFSNVGSTGGLFICYLLFGSTGLSLASLFLLPYPIIIFTLGFSEAHRYGQNQRLPLRESIRRMATHSISFIPIAAMAVGLVLNFFRISPPRFMPQWADVWARLSMAVSCMAIGSTIRTGQWFSPWKPVAAVGIVKFIFTPCIAALLLSIWFDNFLHPSAIVILIQACMPPAVYSVVMANVFRLNRDWANSIWLSNTLFLIPIVGVLFYFFG